MRAAAKAALLLAAIGACAAAGAAPRNPTPESRVVAAGRHVDVHLLDSRLRSEPLGHWLRRAVRGRGTLAWEANDCGEQTGNPANTPADFPVCAEATIAFPDGGKAGISLAVGTYRKGVHGRPVIWHMYSQSPGVPSAFPGKLREFRRLLVAPSRGSAR